MRKVAHGGLLGLLIPWSTQIQADSAESLVKAAFIYRFCDYVRWPSGTFTDADSPIVVGIVDSSGLFADAAYTMAGRKSQGRPVEAQRVRDTEDLENVQVLYIGARISPSMERFLSRNAKPILTITDAAEMSPLSIINFAVTDDKVRFDISIVRARSVGLEVSSDLLSVAR